MADLIKAITRLQPVLNEDELSKKQKEYGVARLATLDKADKSAVGFLSDSKYQCMLKFTQAGVVLVNKRHQADVPAGVIILVVAHPYLAYACISQLFEYQPAVSAVGSIIADTAVIQNGAVIGANAVIGDGAVIGANAVIGDGAVIGARSVIQSGVVIAHHCVVGSDCRIHAGASIGSEGFGFASSGGRWERIAQLGRVVIGNRVRIGANSCIDRGAIDDTVIANDVIIDNLVQIAHNVQIGQGVAIAAGVGVAGSTIIGKGCVIGGMAGIAGHLTIADEVTITAMTLVSKSITVSGSYSSGTTAMPSEQWRRAAVNFRRLGKR